MEKRFVYADNAATTPMSETAFNAMKPWLTENYGNPSSLYRIGRAAKEALNDARTVVGKCLNAAEPVNEKNDYAPGEIVFTGIKTLDSGLGLIHGQSAHSHAVDFCTGYKTGCIPALIRQGHKRPCQHKHSRCHYRCGQPSHPCPLP